jgi:hypothetical protein
MSKYSELVYMVLDEVKGMSDDFTYTEDHVIFLLDKYRGFLLKQRYSDIKKQIPESNYQTICLDLIQIPAISGEPCEGGTYLRSNIKVPFLMQIGTPRVYPTDYYQGDITYVSRDRMRYVGYNKYLKNIIYCSIGPDGYLYFKSPNPQFLYLEKVRFTGIFQDSKEVSKYQCSEENNTGGIMDNDFPIEDALVPPLIELVVKELSNAAYRPEDTENNAHDDLEGLAVKLSNNGRTRVLK